MTLSPKLRVTYAIADNDDDRWIVIYGIWIVTCMHVTVHSKEKGSAIKTLGFNYWGRRKL